MPHGGLHFPVKCPLCRRKKVESFIERGTTGIKVPTSYYLTTTGNRYGEEIRKWSTKHIGFTLEKCKCLFCHLEWELALSREWWKEY